MKRAIGYSLLCFLTACSSPTIEPYRGEYQGSRELNHFNEYVHYLKQRAAAEGVSSSLLNTQTEIRYIESAVRLDKQQAGKPRTATKQAVPAHPHGVTRYLNKVLTQSKVDMAAKHWAEVQPQLEAASRKYGVQKEYILALWGMESSFGRNQGKFDVLSVLATLAFDGRREKLFRQEFVNAMKMLQQGTIHREELKGSWAGAMGQTQFMPTSFLKYAADGNRDGKKDIWKTEADAFASIANYLSTVGWDDKLP